MVQDAYSRTARARMAAYWLTALGLIVGAVTLHGTDWRGNAEMHTVMEAVATVLAGLVGTLALVRFYSRKENTFLFIGSGFLGTAFLDGYHAVVTSAQIQPFMPSDLPSLIPWSWTASRLFLSVFMLLSWFAWRRKQRLGPPGAFEERTVYVFASGLTLVSFLFFAFVPLPAAYYSQLFFPRPEEFVPAALFVAAMVGYLRKGGWRDDPFEHWLVLSLIVGFIAQAAFISHSGRLFDYEFDVAHVLKKASYICVLTGLLINVLASFRQAERSEARLRGAIDSLQEGFALYDADDRLIAFNDEFLRLHPGLGAIIRPGGERSYSR